MQVELDYGLPGSAAASGQLQESILVVCGAPARDTLLEYSGLNPQRLEGREAGAVAENTVICIVIAGAFLGANGSVCND